ncbi:hypothetical protein CIHUM_03010 [Corynebacterium ihumii]|uniref:Uncharacterized protein n=1 Tax=Corynebacterium ihumii TaxID=1232427 RepID=A0ABY7UBH6_9CORY|nr:hypothetical protein CIHUM_03010 [Corynebacterium ihumii]
MPNPSNHVTATFCTFPVDLGVSDKALTNPDLVQAGVGVQAGDDQVDEKQVEDYRGRGQDIDLRGIVIAPPGRGTGMQVGGIEHPGDKGCGLLRIPSSKPAPRGLRTDRVCSAWIRSPYSGAVGKKTVFCLSRKTTTPRRSSCCPVGGLQRLCSPRHSTLLWGLLVAKRAEHPGFHVIGVMAVKCPLTGVVSDQVGDHGFTVAEKDGVLA